MRASYNPALRLRHLTQDATIYEQFHETAHDVQTRIQCWPFRAWLRFNGIRVLGYLATVWIEYDAMRRARQALEWKGLWDKDSEKEGWTNLLSHIKRKAVT